MPWLRQLVAGLIPRRPRFDPGPVNVRRMVDRMALGQVCEMYGGHNGSGTGL